MDIHGVLQFFFQGLASRLGDNRLLLLMVQLTPNNVHPSHFIDMHHQRFV
jgi:hypothetical protein